jgi:hypothetical protein
MGLLIPAGTGLPQYRNIEVRSKDWDQYEEENEAESNGAEGDGHMAEVGSAEGNGDGTEA